MRAFSDGGWRDGLFDAMTPTQGPEGGEGRAAVCRESFPQRPGGRQQGQGLCVASAPGLFEE